MTFSRDPEIEDDRDAIIKVTSYAICRSDLHLFHKFIPAMLPGDIMGHEMIGEVVEVGSGVNGRIKKGTESSCRSRSCGECEQCKRGNFSICERTNRKKDLGDTVFGHFTAGLFGYIPPTSGYPGGQAEFLRVPFAEATPHADEKALFVGDIAQPAGRQPCNAASSRPIR
jgi:threonine dehydrogenase-like Zn-dependent dehydrogenase